MVGCPAGSIHINNPSSVNWGLACVPGQEFDIWVINNTGREVPGLYLCRDPRIEEWGANLLDAPIPPEGIRLVSKAVECGEATWIWPHIPEAGLIAHGVLPVEGTVKLVLALNADGDFEYTAVGCTGAIVTARMMTH